MSLSPKAGGGGHGCKTHGLFCFEAMGDPWPFAYFRHFVKRRRYDESEIGHVEWEREDRCPRRFFESRRGVHHDSGPVTVESEEQTIETAIAVKKAGAQALRGGAFKPRSSPYAFQGLGLKGLQILKKAKEETGLPIVTEVIDSRDVFWVSEYADVLQIGARNMQNFSLLKEVGRSERPVLLKRGMNSTIEEWLNCAEYILSEGNPHVILCERGIRTLRSIRGTRSTSAQSRRSRS